MPRTRSRAVDQFIETHEHCRCIRCDAAIPAEAIWRRMFQSKFLMSQSKSFPTHPLRQELLAYCEGCDAVFGIERVLRDGQWQPVGDVELVTDGRRKTFLERFNTLRGNVAIA